jgi:hypothetical protein
LDLIGLGEGAAIAEDARCEPPPNSFFQRLKLGPPLRFLSRGPICFAF